MSKETIISAFKEINEELDACEERIFYDIRSALSDFREKTGVRVCGIDVRFRDVTNISSERREYAIDEVSLRYDLS